MANLSRLFSVKIGRQTTAAQYGVFGVGIILAPGAAFFGLKYSTYESAKIENFNDLYRVYTSADDAASDGMSGDNLLAVQAYFSQSPSPDTLVVGDFSAAYSKTMIRLTGVPVAGAPAATKATIGYVKGSEYRYAKFNGTAWSGSTGATADIVADSGAEGQFLVDGRIVYLEGAEVVHKSSVVLSAAVSQAIAAIKNQYNRFFMSMTTSRDLSIQKAIADWTESQIDKMAVFIDDYSSPTWATDSITKYIHDKNMAGSFAVSTKRKKNFLDAALAGRCLVMQPGSETWALKTLNAAQSDDFTETDYQKIKKKQRNEELRRQKKTQEIINHAEQEKQKALADAITANDAADRLRRKIASIRRELAASETSRVSADAARRQTAAETASLFADLYEESDRRAGEIAKYADAAASAGRVCERTYEAVTRSVE